MSAPGPSQAPDPKKRDRRWVAILFLAAVLPYLGTLGAGFTNWDDPGYVTDNPDIRGFDREHARAWFTRDYVGNRAPLHLASYALDHALWGLRPFGFHLGNLLLHGLAALLLWRLAVRLGLSTGVAAAGTLIFALHPAGVEVVAWVAERKTLLAACFMLGAALAYLRIGQGRSLPWGTLAVFLFACGMMSKVAIAPFPVLLMALHRCARLRIRNAHVAVIVACLVIALGGGLLTIAIQSSLDAAGRMFGGNLWVHLQVICIAFLHYTQKLLLPVRLSPYYDLGPADLTPGSVALGGALLVTSLGACLALFSRRRPAGTLAVGALLLWLPASSTLVPISTPIADRYLYLPLLFLGPLAAGVVAGFRGSKGGPPLRTAAAAILLCFSVLTILQASHWSSSRRLWQRAVAVQPDNPYARQKLAYTLWKEGDAAAALPHARRAATILPRWLEGLETLGRVALDAGDTRTAEGAFRQQLGLAPNAVNAHVGVARTLRAEGEDRRALQAYLEALRLKRDHREAAEELGALAMERGWEEEALGELPEAPTSVWLDLLRGDLLARLGRVGEARSLWRRVLLARPGFAPARERLEGLEKERLTDTALTE